MSNITDSRAVAEEEVGPMYKNSDNADAQAIASAIVWAGFKISEEIAKLRQVLEARPLA